jgi:nucleoid-associated protein YgaU
MLKEKYQELINYASSLQFTGVETKEDGGKLQIKATAPYAFDKDLFWDKVKSLPSWQTELSADIKVAKTDVYGYYTIKSGDTLSKLAKAHLGDGKRYMEIFNLNKDVLKNPDLIKVGQTIKMPAK